jgi:amino acid transporter
MALAENPSVFNADFFKRILVGRAMPSDRAHHQLLPKTLALAVLSADALSSVAYTVEATVLVLLIGGAAVHQYLLPITAAVAALMIIVVSSYRQTVRAYSTSGGAYVVARENLGTMPALIAAGSLLIGYILTVAVSVVAGVIAITSVVPSLAPHRVELSIIFVGFTTFANLRGLRESGILFALPTYGFIASAMAVILIGVVRCLGDCSAASQAVTIKQEAGLDLLVLLQAFAVGSSALTGVEAISNAVTIFRRPQGRNAAYTLGILGGLAVVLVLGFAWLTYKTGALPTPGASLLSRIGAAALGSNSVFFYLFQAFTFAILVLAANTSFQGFPRLAAMMAKDGYLPRQFENLGDRLVLSNGMIALAVLSSLLIWAFEGNVERLIPLYAVGVFTAFTLSQAGMVVHWQRLGQLRGAAAGHWRRSQLVNAVGAVATALVVLIVVSQRFWQGVWVVAVMLPVMIAGFHTIRKHYDTVADDLRPDPAPAPPPSSAMYEPGAVVDGDGPTPATKVVLLVDALDEATAKALGYARSFAGRGVQAIYVGDPSKAREVEARWPGFCRDEMPMGRIDAARSVDSILAHLTSIPRGEAEFLTVAIPERFSEASLTAAVRHRTAFSLKLRLLAEPGIVVTDVPVLAPNGSVGPMRPLIPDRVETLVFLAGVHRGTLRALRYARSLRGHATRAVYFAIEHENVDTIQRHWFEQRVPLELDIVETPFRDLSTPVLEEVRRVTSRRGAVASVVLPELIVAKRWHNALHNQRALFLKRLLLFEPNVVLSSVPYQLH